VETGSLYPALHRLERQSARPGVPADAAGQAGARVVPLAMGAVAGGDRGRPESREATRIGTHLSPCDPRRPHEMAVRPA
jgi:hypothetical protein